ncbi:DUF4244 domain-containing protein [Lysinibacter sp. HNR]|uniref:DUF4244 domain-containing protein n=1 Tax=Lysinibacter sp. HNR TaxID=3031408 RepID=UPI002434F61E|nr:DUF4244 domain-containing protein [Lysinibacter sp. HNR]WGD37079.1 DUF4244 domain-containing protein [Lysinibacter sp. HNR]
MSLLPFPSPHFDHPSRGVCESSATVQDVGAADKLAPQNSTHRVRAIVRAVRKHWQELLRDEAGAATAEYAVVIMAAVGFAGLLVVILKGNAIKNLLTDLVTRALNSAG